MKQPYSLLKAHFKGPNKEGDIQSLHTVGCKWRYRDDDYTISFAKFINVNGFLAAVII
jgi:hypothetical protein